MLSALLHLLPPTTINTRHFDFNMGQDWALANLDGKIRIRLCLGRDCYYLGDTIFDMLRPRKLVDADDVLVETRGTFLQRQPLSRYAICITTLSPQQLTRCLQQSTSSIHPSERTHRRDLHPCRRLDCSCLPRCHMSRSLEYRRSPLAPSL